jgi:arginyl-tRNA synthetase
MKEIICNLVTKNLEGFSKEEINTLIEIPPVLETGNIIYAQDILNEAIERSACMIELKNPLLKDKASVAKQVGVGAVVFHDLFNQRIKNVDFCWEEVLNFEGSTGPYIQYTYARAKSILRKVGVEVKLQEVNANQLVDEVSYNLVKTIALYPEKISEAAERYEPSVLARYIISLASAFNKFYHDCNIISAEQGVKNARLQVVDLTQKIIAEAMGLLGIECPQEM